MHLFFVGCLALLFAALTGAAPENWTNAQRLARGLPPLPPKFGRTLPGHAWSPTTVSRAKRLASPSASPSPSPLKKYEGRIKVVSSDGEALGYLSNWANGSLSGINYGGPSTELHVSLTVPHSGKGMINILTTNPKFPAPYYIGTTTNATLAPGSPTAVGFRNVEKTHYINPDGSSVNTIIVLDTSTNSIFFVGDADAYNKVSGPVSPVTFYLADF
ncbi:hypothetical protein BU15DRAFT_73887 [Melanogaster broomeanus]|nr:hypothetical protein BU15DRAFT_73887 [Melanogaster broomeanus]